MTFYDPAKPKLFTIWSFTGQVCQPTPALDTWEQSACNTLVPQQYLLKSRMSEHCHSSFPQCLRHIESTTFYACRSWGTHREIKQFLPCVLPQLVQRVEHMAVPWSLVIEYLLYEARLRWNKVPIWSLLLKSREGSLHINAHSFIYYTQSLLKVVRNNRLQLFCSLGAHTCPPHHHHLHTLSTQEWI